VSRCIFCEIVAGRAPASVVFEDDRFLALLDIHPMRPGHTLVIPRRHVVRLDELGADGLALFGFATRVARAVRAGLPCDDVNLVLNDGPAANQTVPHAHVHVIPRRKGDLAALLGRLLVRPIQPKLGAAPRRELDAAAAAIRAGERAD
jgi:diadenosine tetraphosphate (Ap4A) HIT family hydrolase